MAAAGGVKRTESTNTKGSISRGERSVSKVNWIRTTRDLTHSILNIPDCEDWAGNLISPPLVIEDQDGNEYTIEDFFLRGDNKVKVSIKKI